MTRDETKQLLTLLSTAYPKHFRDMSQEEKLGQIALYEDMFKEYPVQIVATALKGYIRDNEYPPTIAGLQKQINLLVPKQDPVELWNTFARAVAKGSVLTPKEFGELPEPIKRWCGGLDTIKELAKIDASSFNTVTRGQFLKSIGTIMEREERQAALPPSMRGMLGNLKMIGGE